MSEGSDEAVVVVVVVVLVVVLVLVLVLECGEIPYKELLLLLLLLCLNETNRFSQFLSSSTQVCQVLLNGWRNWRIWRCTDVEVVKGAWAERRGLSGRLSVRSFGAALTAVCLGCAKDCVVVVGVVGRGG